jgi:hypothetical protein
MIEDLIAANTAALEANTAVLREILAAGGCATPTNVVPLAETPKPAKKAAKAEAKPVEPEPTPEPEQEEPTPANPVDDVLPMTKVAVAGAVVGDDRPEVEEFSDPLDAPKEASQTPEEIIGKITETWKAMLTKGDPERKIFLKDKFPELRAKWGLKEGDKLITLADKPQNLLGLLGDIEAL